MSSDTAACHGYILKVTDRVMTDLNMTKAHLLQVAKDLNVSVNNNDDPDDILTALARDNVEVPVKAGGVWVKVLAFVYDADNGSKYDDLESGETYLIFDEVDLFTKKPTTLMKNLTKLGCKPSASAWTTFG